VRYGLESAVLERLGHGKSALARDQGALLVSRCPEVLAHIGRDLPQPAMVAQGRGEGIRFLQGVAHRSVCSERKKRLAQVQPEIDGLRESIATFWQLRQGCQRLLKIRYSFPVR
jgi:hypothetical protein